MIQKHLKTTSLLLILLIISGCSKNHEKTLGNLEGYWEIEKVTLKDGSIKEYNYNDTIDFISLNDSLQGFRKKMKPNFMGTFETSNDSETFTIKIENDSLNVYYKTLFDSWKETVLFATEDQLQVVNKNDAIFLYKRYEPININ